MNEKSKFIFNEFKSIMSNELLIINSSFANIKALCFALKLIKRNSRFKSFKVRRIRVFY